VVLSEPLDDPSVYFDGRMTQRELTFSTNGELTYKTKAFADGACKTLARTESRQSAYVVGDAATVDGKSVTKLDLTMKKATIVLAGSEDVLRANAVPQLCGLSGWVANGEKDVTGNKSCAVPA